MKTTAMGVQEIADELGRSRAWVYDNWERLVAEKVLPRPIIEKGGLTWSSAQVYAALDRNLTPGQRAAAAAYRAAFAAAVVAETDAATNETVAAAKERLENRFSGTASGG